METRKVARIVVTGGHHTPALAVIDSLKLIAGKEWDLRFFWLGHRHSMWKDKNDSAEYQEISHRQIPFYELTAGKWHASLNPLKLVRVPVGFWQAFKYLRQIKPDLILSFGGYLAVPVCLIGRLLRITVITHEQTFSPGKANRLIGRFSEKVLLSWEGTERFFPHARTILTGLPLRRELWEVKDSPAPSPLISSRVTKFVDAAKQSGLGLLYVTGGKQGSHDINEALSGTLESLLEKAYIVHQCGANSVVRDHERLQKKRLALREELQERYLLQDYFFAFDHLYLFKMADLVVSRAGANSVAEFSVLGTPVLLVPISWSSQSEQYLNAKALSKLGLAAILEEQNLNSQELYRQVVRLLGISAQIKHDYREKSLGGVPHREAAQKASQEIMETLSSLAKADS